MRVAMMAGLSAILLGATVAEAQVFRLQRPIRNQFPTNGSYLFAEDSFGYPHGGIDMAIRYDSVFAASDGVLITVNYNPNDPKGYEPTGGGNYLVERISWYNGANMYLYYMHFTRPADGLASGQTVKTGQFLGISGATGNVTGPHLHFELRYNTTAFRNGERSRRNAELYMALPGTGAIYGNVTGAANATRVNISPDPKPRPPYTNYGYSLTYTFDGSIGSDVVYGENYGIGDVKPGTYTITSINGYRRVVTVAAGQVVSADVAVGVREDDTRPSIARLLPASPNPFNPTTAVSYQLSAVSNVRLDVFDALGRRVRTLVDAEQAFGSHTATFDGAGLPSGVYFARLAVGSGWVRSEKLTLLR